MSKYVDTILENELNPGSLIPDPAKADRGELKDRAEQLRIDINKFLSDTAWLENGDNWNTWHAAKQYARQLFKSIDDIIAGA